jgi:hypothetical protein
VGCNANVRRRRRRRRREEEEDDDDDDEEEFPTSIPKMLFLSAYTVTTKTLLDFK